jgi:hypothetical protein
MLKFILISLFLVCAGLPGFAEPLDFGQQENSKGTESSSDNSNLSENQKEVDEGKFDRGAFDPLNETLPGETGEDGESSSMAGPESMLPGENAEQFKEDDMEPREREGFLRTLPGGLN